MKSFDVVIIGAGAAGTICAIEAGRRKRSVALLDHSSSVGRKIGISGGGRCNFTNLETTPDRYVSENPDFCKSALARFSPADFLRMVRKHGIAYHEKETGQLFCDRSAHEIVNMLVRECEEAGVRFFLGTRVSSIQKKDRFFVRTDSGEFSCRSLVIATGGLSIPSIGATDFGYRAARQFGLAVIEPRPALDGFVFNETDRNAFGSLAGLSLESAVSCKRISFSGQLLFTHLGLSGPVAFQASLYWDPGENVVVNFLPNPPDGDLAGWLIQKKKEGNRSVIRNILAQFVPRRFSEAFCARYFEIAKPLTELSDETLSDFCRALQAWSFVPKSTVGYEKAEVTKGGVDTRELSSKTMESRKVTGLYFIGEVVDVTGGLGGYNFQWAWSSGWAAGQAV